MGIRYLAISIDAEDYEHLSKGPCPSCGEHPQLRDLDYDEDDRETLDLDKSWGYFQGLFHSDTPRPAYGLVAGAVTHTSMGWISFRGLLSTETVREIAADLATVTTDEIQQFFLVRGRRGAGPDARADEDCAYVSSFLTDAQAFTARAAEQGRGILYFIG